jgi:hypothetical protein
MVEQPVFNLRLDLLVGERGVLLRSLCKNSRRPARNSLWEEGQSPGPHLRPSALFFARHATPASE